MNNSEFYEQSKTLFIGKGIGPLVINTSTKKDIDQYLGKGKEIKNSLSFNNHYTTIKTILYSDYGIEVEYSNLKKLRKTDTLRVLKIFNPCNLEISNGIKIGTNRMIVEKLLGSPKKSVYEKLIDGSINHSLLYEGVEFEFNDTIYNPNLMMYSTVKKIIISAGGIAYHISR